MGAGLIARLLGTVQRDGASVALEAPATGFGPAALSTATAGAASLARAQPAEARGRRGRDVEQQDPLQVALGQKVLHGWLQNRHQTLFPLTVNLRNLSAAQVAVLAGMMAVAALACGVPGSDQVARARTWFQQAGADPGGLAAWDAALQHPPAMSRIIDAALAEVMGPYAYVVALIAIDGRDAASLPFLDYLAARLALPVTVIRSANRRYRR